MIRCLLGRLGDDWQVQSPADHLRNLAQGNAFFSDRVIAGSGGTLFESERVEMGNIKPVCSRPAVRAVADVRRDSLLAGDNDEESDQSLHFQIMDLGKAHYRCA